MEYSKKNFGGLRSRFEGLLRAFVLLLAVACGCVPAAAQTTEFVELVSVNAAGTQGGNNDSLTPQSSEDGRLVVFVSFASDIVPNDTNGNFPDVFVRDVQTNTTTLVSVNSAGTGSGSGLSTAPSITPDGRFVIFTSTSRNLVAGDANQTSDIFVRDLQTNTTRLVSVNSAGTASGNGQSISGLITPDGRYAVFNSRATDLVAGGTSLNFHVYRRDLQTNTTALVSVNNAGTDGGNGASEVAGITPDGRYVVFNSDATNLTASDGNGSKRDVFRRDLQTNTTALVSVNGAGTGGGNDQSSIDVRSSGVVVISDDGRVVVFQSSATDLVAPGGPGTGFTSPSVYARDFAANTTTLVSERQVFQDGRPTVPPARHPRVSSDGRYVFYLGPGNSIFRRDLQTGELLELPFVTTGLCDVGSDCLSTVREFVMSRDGRYVAYQQEERMRGNTSTFATAAIIRDMVSGGTEVITSLPGIPSDSPSANPLIVTPRGVVAGGKVTLSGAPHLSAGTNTHEDVYFFSPPATPRVGFQRSAYGVFEDGLGPFPAPVRVRRSGYLIDSTATVRLTTADGSAVAGADYVPRSETLTFNPGESEKTLPLRLVNDELVEPFESFTLSVGDPTGDITLAAQSSTTVTITDDDPHAVLITGLTSASESPGSSFEVTVRITGTPTETISVDYSTADGTASERSDYITASGRLTFAPGETVKNVIIFVVDDGFTELDETFSLVLSNPQGGNVVLGSPSTQQLTILSNDSPPPDLNPIHNTDFFVLQHYLDFLNRGPDINGFSFWTNEIDQCGGDVACREVKRINVSAAFFLSIEFQETGFLAYLTRKAALGARPTFAQFQRDVQALQHEFVFGQPGAPAQLEANKRAYFDEFVARPEFNAKFGGMSNSQYVNTLLTENGLAPTVPNIFVARLEGRTLTQPGTTPPGVFILRRDPNASNNTARLSLRLDSLTSAPTAVHIHRPLADGVAPILRSLPAGEFADLPLTLTNAELTLLNAGQLTLDVHTQNNPDGELSAPLGPIRFRVDVLANALDNGTLTRAQVLRIIAESEELRRAEFNAAFVLMEYFGYLRRDPDPEGFAFWLGKLNEFNGDFIRAEMVKAFISSAEYRRRFGQ